MTKRFLGIDLEWTIGRATGGTWDTNCDQGAYFLKARSPLQVLGCRPAGLQLQVLTWGFPSIREPGCEILLVKFIHDIVDSEQRQDDAWIVPIVSAGRAPPFGEIIRAVASLI